MGHLRDVTGAGRVHLRELGGFSIGTAGFPEGHIACKEGRQVDWDRLKAKIDCGADFVVTQLFFDNADFYAFRDYLAKRGVTVPLVPGMEPPPELDALKPFAEGGPLVVAGSLYLVGAVRGALLPG